MRGVDLVVIHCSDSDHAHHDNIKIIENWHKERGFKKIGYHYVITKDGKIHQGREEQEIGAHAQGYNKRSIGICLTGKNKFTEAQFETLEKLVKDICERYAIQKQDVLAHNELNPDKTCPNFDLHHEISKWNWF